METTAIRRPGWWLLLATVAVTVAAIAGVSVVHTHALADNGVLHANWGGISPAHALTGMFRQAAA
jgi:hypothetical protein